MHNESKKIASLTFDLFECLFTRSKFSTAPSSLIKREWSRLFSFLDPTDKLLQTCTSAGAIHVKNALITSPKSVRDRIIVLAINPARIIPKHLCFDSFNFASKRDFVTRTDIQGNILYRDQIKYLDPHPDAQLFDHAFTSPTFHNVIEKVINQYIAEYGSENGKRK